MANERLQRWLRPAVAGMSAYHVADASGMVKLDAMENPYPIPDSLKAGWLEALSRAQVNRYPDPHASELKQQLRAALRLPETAGLILGNGSDEIIQMLMMAVGGEGRVVLSPEPSFVMYRLMSGMNGLNYVGVDLAADFMLPMPAMLEAIEQHQPALVFVANPNNPTGNVHSLEQLRELAEACPGLLIVDEAYAPFTDTTAVSLMGEYPHLLVMRTLSKMGLAGLRLGYLLGAMDWINELEKVRLPYNINSLSQQAGCFALQHHEVFLEQARRIRTDRAELMRQLSELDGVRVVPSEANFILFYVPPGRGAGIFDCLKSKGVLIKNLSGGHALLQDALRVTVGSAEENRAFLDALGTCL